MKTPIFILAFCFLTSFSQAACSHKPDARAFINSNVNAQSATAVEDVLARRRERALKDHQASTPTLPPAVEPKTDVCQQQQSRTIDGLTVECFTLASAIGEQYTPLDSSTIFPSGANFVYFLKLSSQYLSYRRIELRISQNKKIVRDVWWNGENLTFSNKDTGVYLCGDRRDQDCNILDPGTYTAEIMAQNHPSRPMVSLSKINFQITGVAKDKTEDARAVLTNKAPDQLAKIADLKKSLSEKIELAKKEQTRFTEQVKAVGEKIAQGKELPELKLARLNRDLKRKQTYLKQVSDYHDEFAKRWDTLDEIEDDFNDRSHWRALINDTFVSYINQQIQEITALLNDAPLANQTTKPTKPERRKRK